MQLADVVRRHELVPNSSMLKEGVGAVSRLLPTQTRPPYTSRPQ
jgi:hypothetical protein